MHGFALQSVVLERTHRRREELESLTVTVKMSNLGEDVRMVRLVSLEGALHHIARSLRAIRPAEGAGDNSRMGCSNANRHLRSGSYCRDNSQRRSIGDGHCRYRFCWWWRCARSLPQAAGFERYRVEWSSGARSHRIKGVVALPMPAMPVFWVYTSHGLAVTVW